MSRTNGHESGADTDEESQTLAERVDKLEQENQRLEATVQALDSRVADIVEVLAGTTSSRTMRSKYDGQTDLLGRVMEIETEMAAVQSIGNEKSTKEEKIAQVVAFAENQRSPDTNATTVTMQNIKGATGVSRRYAYDLAEDMIAQYDWALDPAEQTRAVDQKQRQRGVMVDFEQLHTDPAAVNKFTTPSGRKGAGE